MASFPWEEEILDGFAASVSFEVRTCTAQLEALVEEHGNQIPAPPQGFGPGGTPKDAMLQAGLMHLRSLDDFLTKGEGGSPGRPPDIRAVMWLGDKWRKHFWLDPRVRALIDWNVVHLSTMRTIEQTAAPFRLADYGEALCEEMLRFFQCIKDHRPERLPAFEWDVQGDLQRRLPVFAKHSSHSPRR